MIFQSHLSCLVKCVQVHLLMFLAIFAWLLTFGHFGANGIAKYWTSLWPFVYMYLVYLFASFVVPVGMAMLYGLLSGSACRQVLKGIGVLFQSEREHPGKLHRTVGFCFRFCDRDEESLLGRCFGRLENGYNFLMPHRELQLEDEDRELLLSAWANTSIPLFLW